MTVGWLREEREKTPFRPVCGYPREVGGPPRNDLPKP